MHGLIVVDKSAGISSSGALDPLKEALGRGVKIGHAGTLDPFATGALLVLLGDATRLSPLAMGLPKTYEATVRFGRETDTLDPEGTVVAEAEPGASPPTGLDGEIARFEGEILQTPPAFSALKVGGRRAYRIARSGGKAELAARTVAVHEIRRIDDGWPEMRIHVTCGAGTYIRAIARDLGRAIGLPAMLTALRRTRIGPFEADAGLPIGPEDDPPAPDALRERLVPPLDVVRAAGIPEVGLDREWSMRFVHGAVLESDGEDADPVALLSAEDGILLGLGAREDGLIRPTKVFASAQRALLG